MFRNHSKIEQQNILWVRLNAGKLRDVWQSVKYGQQKDYRVSTDDYILCQLAYVFAKHCFKEFPENYSELCGRILDDIKNSTSDVIGDPIEGFEVKRSKDILNDSFPYFLVVAKRKKIQRYSEYFKYIEKQIAITEQTYLNENKRRRNSERSNRDSSYMIEFLKQAEIDPFNKGFVELKFLGNFLRDFRNCLKIIQ